MANVVSISLALTVENSDGSANITLATVDTTDLRLMVDRGHEMVLPELARNQRHA